jgi:hypothetical protein
VVVGKVTNGTGVKKNVNLLIILITFEITVGVIKQNIDIKKNIIS